MKRVHIQIKRAHNRMIRVHYGMVHYGMKRAQNQIFLKNSRMARAQNQML